MSEDLVNLAQRWPERAATHYGDHEAEQAGATPEASSAAERKGDAMSEKAHETTETQGAVNVSDHGGVLLRISRGGLWVNPDIPADECAQRVLASLRPILSHTINTEVNMQVARLTAERDAAEAEVERLTNERDKARANSQAILDSSRPDDDHRAEVKRLTVDRDEALARVHWLKADLTEAATKFKRVIAERDEAQGTIYRLAGERDAAEAEVERLKELLTEESKSRPKLIDSMTSQLRATADRMTAERDEARAEVERLKEQVATLTVGMEWADKLQAYAEAAEAETVRVVADGNKALAEVERLTGERDAALAEVERLTNERDTAQANVKWLIDRGNGKASLHRSRATDEDIWREAFMALCGQSLKEGYMIRAESADAALAVYRKRWPQWPEGFNVSNGCNAK
jgi:DNA repair exonuclease SbcCD ATPase subunit